MGQLKLLLTRDQRKLRVQKRTCCASSSLRLVLLAGCTRCHPRWHSQAFRCSLHHCYWKDHQRLGSQKQESCTFCLPPSSCLEREFKLFQLTMSWLCNQVRITPLVWEQFNPCKVCSPSNQSKVPSSTNSLPHHWCGNELTLLQGLHTLNSISSPQVPLTHYHTIGMGKS